IGVVALRVALQLGIFLAFAASFVAAGMMLGNGVSYLAATAAFAWLLARRLGPLGLRRTAARLARIVVAAVAAGVAGALAVRVLPGGAEPGKLEALLQLVVGGLAVTGTYLGGALLLRVDEIREGLHLVRRRLLRRCRPGRPGSATPAGFAPAGSATPAGPVPAESPPAGSAAPASAHTTASGVCSRP